MSLDASLPADIRFERILREFHLAGRLDEARELYRGFLADHPDHAGALANLGQILRRQGATGEALAIYRRAADLPDAAAELLFNLGNAEDDAGHVEAALEALGRSVRRKPDLVQAHHKRGLILSRLGRWPEAVEALRAALRAGPRDAVVRCDLAVALKHDGAPELAEPLFRWAIEAQPDAARPRRLLADLLAGSRRLGEAEGLYRDLLGGQERDAAVLALSEMLVRQDRLEEAVEMLRERHRAVPADTAVALTLAGVLLKVHMLVEAATAAEGVLRREPDNAAAHFHLASACTLLHRNAEALSHGLRALEPPDASHAAVSNLLFASLNSDDLSAKELAALHRDQAHRLSGPEAPAVLPRPDRRGGIPITLGFYSPDLHGNHPVAQFLGPVLRHLDLRRFRPVVYSRAGDPDARTAWFQERVPHWRDVIGRGDEEIAAQLREDRLDILVDLTGHTADSGLRFFARRMAPVQVSFIGYPHSTGLAEMDFIISDAVVSPPELEHLYAETVLRPNPVLWCFEPPPEQSIRRRARLDGRVTFGTLNSTAKLSGRCLGLWARILARCPGAVLLLKAGGFAEPATVDLFRQRLVEAGADPGQLLFEPPEPFEAALGAYDAIDIVLDTIPFNGGTTTCQALWMGAPVVTRQGEAMCQRLSSSFLAAVGLQELVTTTDEAYVELACALAQDPGRLARLREGLRQRVLASPICQGASYTRNLEDALAGLL